MIVDPAIVPGLLLLAAELAALAAVGYVVVRVALRQADARAALAQGLVVGPALWGLIVEFRPLCRAGACGRGDWLGRRARPGHASCVARTSLRLASPARGGGLRRCRPGPAVADARRTAVARKPGPHAASGVVGVDPRGRFPAGDALESWQSPCATTTARTCWSACSRRRSGRTWRSCRSCWAPTPGRPSPW